MEYLLYLGNQVENKSIFSDIVIHILPYFPLFVPQIPD